MATAEVLSAHDLWFGELARHRAGQSSLIGLGSQPDTHRDFSRLLSLFEPISLAAMDGVALLDRSDTKYVMSLPQLHSVLTALPQHYRVLDIDGTRLNRYRTLYFDTGDFDLYRDHHSGKRVRYKVRSREYVDTNQSFLEVKWKTKRDRTKKHRIQTAEFVREWGIDTCDLVDCQVPQEAQSLEPRVLNEFRRITLVSKLYRERVTLDLDLQFSGDGRTIALPGIATAEVKQDGVNRGSESVRQMRAAGIRPSGFSKYCIGVSLLYPDVKHNRFKAILRRISKVMGDDYDV